MKPVSVEIQRKIMYIPYVNYVIPLLFLYNTHLCYEKSLSRIRVLWIFFSSCLPLIILAQLVYRFHPAIGTISEHLNAYLIPLILGYRFTNLQEELEFE